MDAGAVTVKMSPGADDAGLNDTKTASAKDSAVTRL
jgi:hypothetical protein